MSRGEVGILLGLVLCAIGAGLFHPGLGLLVLGLGCAALGVIHIRFVELVDEPAEVAE